MITIVRIFTEQEYVLGGQVREINAVQFMVDRDGPFTVRVEAAAGWDVTAKQKIDEKVREIETLRG